MFNLTPNSGERFVKLIKKKKKMKIDWIGW